MNDFDWSDLDGHGLRLLVAVTETGSITRAAAQMGITQSAVSHQLDKLRGITGDALFVKSGRGIVPTARALALAGHARELLRQLQGFAHAGAFDPAHWHAVCTIAANDFQREVLLPALAARLRVHAPHVSLRIIPSNIPSLQLLRDGPCELVISPRPPEGSDIMQKRLFEDSYRVFFDPQSCAPPHTRDDYTRSDHITVVYEDHRPLELDRWLDAQGVQRRLAVRVPGFGGIPAFLRGSPLLATVPGLLADHLLRGFAHVDVPLPCPRLPMYLIWHVRHQHDDAHRWLRQQLEAVAKAL